MAPKYVPTLEHYAMFAFIEGVKSQAVAYGSVALTCFALTGVLEALQGGAVARVAAFVGAGGGAILYVLTLFRLRGIRRQFRENGISWYY